MVTLVNRAKVSTSTTGTGTVTLGTAFVGYQTFAAAGVSDADVVRYVIEDGDAWEIGTGTYSSTGPTLTRSVIESSNADAALNLSGLAAVYVTAVSSDLQNAADMDQGVATTDSPSWRGIDLAAIAASKAVTAVDVFVYDTSKDSDGGAWRKRTQHTSWYNETLNTATRGSRREFPAVAVIVAESDTVTIYDGDDPDMPMWMVFLSNTSENRVLYSSTMTSVSGINGILSFGRTVVGLAVLDLVSDEIKGYRLSTETTYQGYLLGGFINRNYGVWTREAFSPTIVNAYVNDVAMTVLPDAPIDPATGLPVPTIAVATAGGVSVIKDDGTVVDITSGGSLPTIGFDAENYLYASDSNVIRHGLIPSADTSLTSWSASPFTATSVPAIKANTSKISKSLFGSPSGLALVAHDKTAMANSMVAYTTSTYNTGWMNGDIKGAFLSDTDDTDLVGSGELVTNGTFDSDTSGWTAFNGATISVVSGKLRVTNGASGRGGAGQAVPTTAGKVYVITLDGITSPNSTNVFLYVGTYLGNGSIANLVNINGTGLQLTFVAQGSATWVTLLPADAVSGDYNDFDNISVKLADADRSVNNKGLIVNGTVTREPVATGAELVAYSGFSSSNYLEQPYNSALDFGTGDFCVMGWSKGARAIHPMFSKNNGSAYSIILGGYSTSSFWFGTKDGSGTSTIIATSSHYSNVWNHHCGVRKDGVMYLYENGVLIGTSSNTVRNVTQANDVLAVGYDASGSGGDSGSNLYALFRISATAPTSEQITKIYEDEKVLFQENAKAVLAGTSDAVTALAYDDTTEELLVGTSQYTSVFRGLRRVDEISGSASAISASNGLRVIED